MRNGVSQDDIITLKKLFISRDSEVYIHDLNQRFELGIRERPEKNIQIEGCALIISGNDHSAYEFSDFDRVIHFGTSKIQKHKFKKEFRYIRINQSIRWVYPKGQLKTVFNFQHTSTLKARLFKNALKLLAFCHLDSLISRPLGVYSANPVELSITPCNIPHDDYSIFMGAPGIERTALIALLNDGKSTSFLKIGLNTLTQRSVGNEAHILYSLSHRTFRHFAIPEMRNTKYRGVISLSKLEGIDKKATHSFSAIHANVLCELMNFSCRPKRFLETSFGESIIDNCRRVINLNLIDTETSNLLEENIDEIPYDFEFKSSLAHGDFTPWNMFLGNHKLHLYDWKASMKSAPLFFDLFHYHFQTGTFLKKWSFDQIYTQIMITLERFPELSNIVAEQAIDIKRYLQLYVLYISSQKLGLATMSGARAELNSQQLKVWKQALSFTAKKTQCRRTVFIEEFNEYISIFRHAYLTFEARSLSDLSLTSDLDIAVRNRDLDKILTFCKDHTKVIRFKTVRKSFMTTIELFFDDNGFLSIDLIHDFRRKWVRFMNIEHLLISAHKNGKGIAVPDLRFDVEYALMFYTLNGAGIPDRYVKLFTSAKSILQNRTLSYFEHKYELRFNELKDLLSASDQCTVAFNKKLAVNLPTFFKSKLRMMIQYLSDVRQEWLGRRGFILTISSVDGVGKTQVMNIIKEKIQKKYRKEVVLLRHRPHILPMLSTFKYGSLKVAEGRSGNSDPGTPTTNSRISSSFRFAYYYVDYFLGQFYIHAKYVWRGKIVLYDSYYFDLMNNPERSNLNINKVLGRSLYRLIMKPALNIFLYAPAEVIAKRKKELDVATINRLTKKHLSTFGRFSAEQNRSTYVVHRNSNLQNTVALILNDVQKIA